MIRLSVIYVMFNEFEPIKKAIDLVYKEKIKDMELILMDNSTDKQGYKSVLKRFPKIKFFQNKTDIGFSRAVNIAFTKAKGEFILVLTPDMYILPGTIKKTLDYIEKHSDVGWVSCKVYSSPGETYRIVTRKYPDIFSQVFYYNMPLYKIIHRFFPDYHPYLYSAKDHDKILHPKIIGGAYELLRKKAIDDIGGFDPQYYMYFDDYDLSKTLMDKGWKVIYLPVGGIVQSKLADWKEGNVITQSYPLYMESLYKFYKKHFGRLYAFFTWIAIVVSSIMSVIYLFIVSIAKRLIGHESQSTLLLPLWQGIVMWHFKKGLRVILS